MTLIGREERLQDFMERRASHPGGEYSCASGTYLPTHPFSDDVADLERLDMAPEACRSVDAYWHDGSDVAFVQVTCVSPDDPKVLRSEPGLYARVDKQHSPNMVYLWGTTQETVVSRAEFESVLAGFVRSRVLHDPSNLTKDLQKVGEYGAA